MSYKIIAFGYLALGAALMYIWLVGTIKKVVIEASTDEQHTGEKETKADFTPQELRIVS